MVSSSVSALLRLAGWSYMPDFATRIGLQVIHSFLPTLTGKSAPAPRTPAYAWHYRLMFAAVVLGYLVYNLVESSQAMQPSFYELLGIMPDANELQLKAAFRTFARQYHPDRVGAQGEELFMRVRDAYDGLKDPVKRFAYDRFGPSALEWTSPSTIKEYLHHGLIQSLGFHIVSGVILIGLSLIGKRSPVAFWRWILFIALFLSEMALIVGPSAVPAAVASLPSSASPLNLNSSSGWKLSAYILSFVFPQRVAYQHILLLHQLFMFASVAVSRVAPVMFPPTIDEVEGIGMEPAVLMSAMTNLENMGRNIDGEVTHLLQTQMHAMHPLPTVDDGVRYSTMRPYDRAREDAALMDRLSREMETLIVEGRLRREAKTPGLLHAAWTAALARAPSSPLRRPSFSPRKSSWWARSGSQARAETARLLTVDIAEDDLEDEARLPSPVSTGPETPPEKNTLPLPVLPSPRPSPEPFATIEHSPKAPNLERRESYTRGRSISLQ